VKIPFSRTVRIAPQLGLRKHFYSFLLVTLEFISERLLKRFPRGVVVIKTRTNHKMLLYLGKNVRCRLDIHRNLFESEIREPYLVDFDSI